MDRQWPKNTLTYFRSPIFTTAHAPTDIELLERAHSSENTIWKSSVGNPAKLAKILKGFLKNNAGTAYGHCPAEWPENTLKYLQSPISTAAHAPTDIELLERADSSEKTIWKSSVGNPEKFAKIVVLQQNSVGACAAVDIGLRKYFYVGEGGIGHVVEIDDVERTSTKIF